MALFDLCAAMLDSLRDGHVNLYSAFDRSYNTAWYDTFPTNFSSGLQALYLHDYRIAGGLYYCMINDGKIGYIYYSSFSNSVSANNLYWIFSTFKDCKGLIIDVRNNGGGEIIEEKDLTSDELASKIKLVLNNEELYNSMKESLKKMSMNNSSDVIYNKIKEMIK